MSIEVHCAFDKMVAVAALTPNPRNPNKHPPAQVKRLAEIIRARGWRVPITVSNRSGFVVRGHGRLMAAELLRVEEVPVDYQDYATEADEYADLIADNRIAEFAEIDDAAQAELLRELEADGFDLNLAGFSDGEFQKLLDGLNKDAGGEEPEVEFTRELLLEHNYIVLYFDNPLDWQVALAKFELKKVKDLIPRKEQPIGIGRVVPGRDWLDRIQ